MAAQQCALELLGFTIITGGPNSLTAELHNRMPVILEPANGETWLSATATTDPQALRQSFPVQLMIGFPMSRRVTSPKMMIRKNQETLIQCGDLSLRTSRLWCCAAE